jgi:hypothetical protein
LKATLTNVFAFASSAPSTAPPAFVVAPFDSVLHGAFSALPHDRATSSSAYPRPLKPVRLEHTVQHRTAYPPTDHSYYIRTDLHSESDRLAKLRLALDDWAIVWLNGEKLATLDHSRGFDTALIPVQLKGGDNQLVIKTNNKQNTDRLIWVINCCLVED